VNVVGWPISIGLTVILGFGHMLLFGDFVSEFAKVAGWQLTAWYLHLVRRCLSLYNTIDLAYLIAHWNDPNTDGAVHPNVITGWWALGNIFGLKNSAISAEGVGYDKVQTLKEEERKSREAFYEADEAYQKAVAKPETPKVIAAKKKTRDKLEKSWNKKRNQLADILQKAGAVSPYATTDVLEDIAETITAITFGASQLNDADDDVFVTHKSTGMPTAGFARRLSYLIDAGLFTRKWKPLVVGKFMRGNDSRDQLHEWEIEL
jgi:hypothetical protein